VTAHHSTDGRRLTAPVPVAGSAMPGATIRLYAGCSARSCSRFVLSDERGRFAAPVKLVFSAGTGKLTLRAEYATGVPQGPTATVTVRVHRPAALRRARHRPGAASSPPPSSSTEQATPPAQATIPAPVTPPANSTQRRTMVVIGDSLAVGMRPWLAATLPGWQVSIDGRTGRPLAEGMSVLAATTLSAPSKTALAISLFTNDDPTQTSRLQAAIDQTLRRAGSGGCVIWATIARPAVGGVTYKAANALLQRRADADPRLQIVPWAQYTAANPGVLAADGVHPGAAGYRERALMYAQAAQRCP
jgi:hypothetical protein